MALKRVSEFAWDGLLSRVSDDSVRKSVNILRNKANEITTSSAKYVKPPAAIDFAGAKSKLKFTASAVDSLQAIYDKKTLPTYTATLPAFEAKKRAELLNIAKSTVAAASEDLTALRQQLELFEEIRIKDSTSISELRDRFPVVAKEIEKEIDSHQWLKDTN